MPDMARVRAAVRAVIGDVDYSIREADGEWSVQTDAELSQAAQDEIARRYSILPSGPTLAEKREAAVMERADFCMALLDRNILDDDEAIEASRGGWPPSFDAAVPLIEAAGIPRARLMIDWGSRRFISRTHPALLVLAPMAGLTEADLDKIFGITE